MLRLKNVNRTVQIITNIVLISVPLYALVIFAKDYPFVVGRVAQSV